MKMQSVPRRAYFDAPRPTLERDGDLILVRSEVCFVPVDLWSARSRLGSLWEAGVGQTWAKVKAKSLAEECGAERSAFSLTGLVEQAGKNAAGIRRGDRVAACGFGQAVSADYYVVKEEQCTLLGRSPGQEWAAGVLVGSWLYQVLKRARLERYEGVLARADSSIWSMIAFACEAVGLSLAADAEPLTRGPLLWIARNAAESRQYLRRKYPRERDIVLIDLRREVYLSKRFHSVLQTPSPGTAAVSPYAPAPLDWPVGLAQRERAEWIELVRRKGGLRVPNEFLDVRVTPSEKPTARGGGNKTRRKGKGWVGVSFLGAGNFARAVLMPAVTQNRHVVLRGVVDRRPGLAAGAVQALGAAYATADYRDVLDDPKTDAVFIATYHGSHAELAAKALEAGKKVFVEKPPAVNRSQLDRLLGTIEATDGFLAVGYNRRNAEHTKRALDAIEEQTGPTVVSCSVQLWRLPENHWYYWSDQGGRIIGNACHWIDLGYFLVGRQLPIDCVAVTSQWGRYDEDLTLVFTFDDGSLVTVSMTCQGSSLLGGSEVIDIKRGNVSVLINDYVESIVRTERNVRRVRTKRDRGHAALLRQVVEAMLESGDSPYTLQDLQDTSAMIFTADETALKAAERQRPPVGSETPTELATLPTQPADHTAPEENENR
jgi:predicted dehydrogenase